MGKKQLGKTALLSGASTAILAFSSVSAQDSRDSSNLNHKYHLTAPSTTDEAEHGEDPLAVNVYSSQSNNYLYIKDEEVEEVAESNFSLIIPEEKRGYLSLTLPLASWHGRKPAEGYAFNEFNPGIGLDYRYKLHDRFDGSWISSVAVFEDSYGLPSGIVMSGYSIPVPEMERLHVGFVGALAYKGRDFNRSQEVIAAPLLHLRLDITDTLSISSEGVPFPIGEHHKTPFMGFRANWKFDGPPP